MKIIFYVAIFTAVATAAPGTWDVFTKSLKSGEFMSDFNRDMAKFNRDMAEFNRDMSELNSELRKSEFIQMANEESVVVINGKRINIKDNYNTNINVNGGDIKVSTSGGGNRQLIHISANGEVYQYDYEEYDYEEYYSGGVRDDPLAAAIIVCVVLVLLACL